MLGEWAGVPPHQAHVLLDRDGKTLSHAFIEAHPNEAREILVSCRNKVLGSGKRARRVTLTTSSQDELLHEVCMTCKTPMHILTVMLSSCSLDGQGSLFGPSHSYRMCSLSKFLL